MSCGPQFTITPALLSLVEQIAVLRERIQGAAVELSWIPALQKDTRTRNGHASTAIEGNPLTLEQVRALEEGRELAAVDRRPNGSAASADRGGPRGEDRQQEDGAVQAQQPILKVGTPQGFRPCGASLLQLDVARVGYLPAQAVLPLQGFHLLNDALRLRMLLVVVQLRPLGHQLFMPLQDLFAGQVHFLAPYIAGGPPK
jgi:hypothetical protein